MDSTSFVNASTVFRKLAFAASVAFCVLGAGWSIGMPAIGTGYFLAWAVGTVVVAQFLGDYAGLAWSSMAGIVLGVFFTHVATLNGSDMPGWFFGLMAFEGGGAGMLLWLLLRAIRSHVFRMR